MGKIILSKFADLFSKEDQMMTDLKILCKIYDRRVSLALIPFYKDRLIYIENQLEEYSHLNDKNSLKE